MTHRASIVSRLQKRLAQFLRKRRFANALEHVHGDGFAVPEGEVLAIVLVRDGAYYLDAFFDYYRKLGIRHFAFIDNGSTDETLARLRAEEGCVVDRAVLPLAQYEDLIRAYPAQTYGQNRWCLYVDMDEQFDFEGREAHGLPALIQYLESRGKTAMMAQMLEMFPNAPLAEVQDQSFAEALACFDYYDISTVSCFDYHAREIPFEALLRGNQVATDALQFKFGGVRHKVFGEDCCLTKHPLIFNRPEVVPAPHPHLSQNVKVSDITGVIRHYKFAGNIAARDAESAGSGDLAHGEDEARLKVLSAQSQLTLHSKDAHKWEGIEPLYKAEFLNASQSYRDFLAKRPT
ncbi:glycosyltransferase family 2 protein [Sulfitobacter donghicola]|uniref:Glycosyl transferase family 2 n=1 Tax=Sulfitobacter donghicola DSW-25 = KCTC 12864 = JCM 14565 TaxID=1300350 RepID=A0A073IFY4_9RHOB|nr:glycosyltransferase family 2 protein [Sulfitobacter donghicola]KEJ89253.1 hypothetical protein DSW25_09495 [Sulfitobacter donghicola DSW-25 = KCTC 12864 = JCM 14565]KIN69049.1 Glyco tranf 2 4 domain containing protein [Sulfitobacter donghicola DSW-25 = KCTC 12864 = JCM 14565]